MAYAISGSAFRQGNPPQYLTYGQNPLGAGRQNVQSVGFQYPLPGQSSSAPWKTGGTQNIAGGLKKAGGLLAMLGGPAGAVGLGLAGIGTIAGLFGGNPYKKMESRTKKRFNILRAIASRRIGGASAASINRARQSMAGQGLQDSAVFQQLAKGYEADYSEQLSGINTQLLAEEEEALAQLDYGRADWRNQRRLGLTSLAKPGFDLLMGSLNPQYRGGG